MVLIIICIIFLTFDQKVDEAEEIGLTAKEKRVKGGIAIACALCAPMVWSIKMIYMRKAIDGKYYRSTGDMALDSMLVFGLTLTVLFLVYYATHEVVLETFV